MKHIQSHILYIGMTPVLKWFLGLCVCLLIASCSESEKERLSRLVKEWEGKEILFPAHSTFTIQGKDTVDFDFDDAEGTLEVKVIYEAEQAEHFNKTVTVYCNAENSTLRLTVTGNAK